MDNHLLFWLSNKQICPVSVGDCYTCNKINRCGYLRVSSAAKLLPCSCDKRVSYQNPVSCFGRVREFGSSWSCSCRELFYIYFNPVFINGLHTVPSWWSMAWVTHSCDCLNFVRFFLIYNVIFWLEPHTWPKLSKTEVRASLTMM